VILKTTITSFDSSGLAARSYCPKGVLSPNVFLCRPGPLYQKQKWQLFLARGYLNVFRIAWELSKKGTTLHRSIRKTVSGDEDGDEAPSCSSFKKQVLSLMSTVACLAVAFALGFLTKFGSQPLQSGRMSMCLYQ
jgi:hypothetical protein